MFLVPVSSVLRWLRTPSSPGELLRVLDGLWYAGSAPHTLMALTALLAGTLALAAIIPQQPAGLAGAAAEQWLTGAASGYRQAGSFLRAVGAFHITSSPWTRAILAALALNLTLRVAAQAGFLHRLWRSPGTLNAPPRLIVQRAALPGALDILVNQTPATLRPRFSSVAVAVDHDAERAQMVRSAATAGRHRSAAHLRRAVADPARTAAERHPRLARQQTSPWRPAIRPCCPPRMVCGSRSTALPASNPRRLTLSLTRMNADRNVRIAANQPARWGSVWLTQQEIAPPWQ